jgi:26S proteasome non-ATPase regulatory subunit 10
MLLQKGAEIGRQHFLGTTALHFAASGGDVELCDFLLEHGADIDRVGRKFDPAGQTPLQVAIRRDRTEVIQLLRDRGARG